MLRITLAAACGPWHLRFMQLFAMTCPTTVIAVSILLRLKLGRAGPKILLRGRSDEFQAGPNPGQTLDHVSSKLGQILDLKIKPIQF